MADDTRQADGGRPETAPSASVRDDAAKAPRPELRRYAQLKLDATIVGPGMRTEDYFEPGTRLKIQGQQGTFTYRYASVSRTGEVSLHLAQNGIFRAVRPDRVSLVAKPRRSRP